MIIDVKHTVTIAPRVPARRIGPESRWSYSDVFHALGLFLALAVTGGMAW